MELKLTKHALSAYFLTNGNQMNYFQWKMHSLIGYYFKTMLFLGSVYKYLLRMSTYNMKFCSTCLMQNFTLFVHVYKLLIDKSFFIQGETPIDMAVAAKLPNLVKRLRQISEMRGSGKSNCLTRYTSDKVCNEHVQT